MNVATPLRTRPTPSRRRHRRHPHHLHDDLACGEGISGPAARRAIHAAAQAPTFAGSIRALRQARDILDNALTVYDNPRSFLMCVYNRERALCHRLDTAETPSLDWCWPTCANVARTDQHPAQLRNHANTGHRVGRFSVLVP
ncbi:MULTISPECIES: hypothetical protein [unclassified Streptomyces]|uniref:hypothetical protein n=1 Tax=Streptomyces sp. NPDC127532 TaxID=3345399 RepID=UPI0036375614